MSNKKKLFNQFRIKRLGAFFIDVMFVLFLIFIVYTIAGFPNFPAVFEKMRMLNIAGNEASHGAQVKVMSLFNIAYLQALSIWICYDLLSMLLLKGATLGKLIMGLRLIPENNKMGIFGVTLLVILRSLIKFTSMFILQGIPFVITIFSVFADEKSTTGYDRLTKLVIKSPIKKKELTHNL